MLQTINSFMLVERSPKLGSQLKHFLYSLTICGDDKLNHSEKFRIIEMISTRNAIRESKHESPNAIVNFFLSLDVTQLPSHKKF
jgi:hypothetical protein